MSDLFFIAAKENYTFPSPQGNLSVSDLFRLPLTSTKTTTANLDDVAKAIDAEVEKAGEKSFVSTSASSAKRRTLENKLDVVKAVIADKIADNEAKAQAEKRADTRKKIDELLEEKEGEELKGKSREELLALRNTL